VLSGILRLSDGLDRSHHQLVSGIASEDVDGTLRINVSTTGDAELEVWGARRKAKLLERVLGRNLELVLDGKQTAASA
jgi:exopolyphosphatase/guanosine-5'-triphosphate,3'-diphosphate pyrophosphatase